MGNCQTACCTNELQEQEVNTTIDAYFANHQMMEDALAKGQDNITKVVKLQSWVRGTRVRSQVVREISELQDEVSNLKKQQKQLELLNKHLNKTVQDLQDNYKSQRVERLELNNLDPVPSDDHPPLKSAKQHPRTPMFSKMSNIERGHIAFSSHIRLHLVEDEKEIGVKDDGKDIEPNEDYDQELEAKDEKVSK